MDEPRLSNKKDGQNETYNNHQRVEAQRALLSITIEGSPKKKESKIEKEELC